MPLRRGLQSHLSLRDLALPWAVEALALGLHPRRCLCAEASSVIICAEASILIITCAEASSRCLCEEAFSLGRRV